MPWLRSVLCPAALEILEELVGPVAPRHNHASVAYLTGSSMCRPVRRCINGLADHALYRIHVNRDTALVIRRFNINPLFVGYIFSIRHDISPFWGFIPAHHKSKISKNNEKEKADDDFHSLYPKAKEHR
jgi:hypothetical protein